jgi:predicted nucleic acid-binding protein
MTTTNARTIFIDTNILLRANVAEAPLHIESLAAIKSLRAKGDELYISRQVLREFMATLTRPQTFATPRPANVIIERVQYFQTHFRVIDETTIVTDKLLTLLHAIPMGGRQVHDANIVASMLASGVDHLLTLNTVDFARFSPYIVVWSLEQAQ